MIERLGLRLRVLLFFALLLAGTAGALVAGLGLALHRAGQGAGAAPDLTAVLVQGGLFAGMLAGGLIIWVWYLFDANVARAIDRLSGALRARAHSPIDSDLAREAEAARYLGELAPAARDVSVALSQMRNALAESVARETTRLSAEKYRLETLLADVPVAVLLCNADHQLVFYNGPAVDILAAGETPGLNSNLLDYLREGPIAHAYARLAAAGDADAASDLMCTTLRDARVLSGRMRVLRRREEGIAPGYVLTLRDVTAELAAQDARDALLDEVFEQVRRPAANLQTVIGVLSDLPAGEAPDDLRAAAHDEVARLTRTLADLGARHDRLRTDWRPLVQTRSADLMDSLTARFAAAGLALTCDGPDLILQMDGFEVVALLGWLGATLAEAGHARAFHLSLIEEDGPGAILRLTWQGPPVAMGTLDRWLDSPPPAGSTAPRQTLRQLATSIWPEQTADRAALVMPVPAARRAVRRPAPIRRAVVYDFDLLSKARNAAVADTRLEDLTFVVFDTETTGLSPDSDEIVQSAAVRVVNGRRVTAETLDTLVDPGRPIPPGATEVHGITDSMVVGAPTIGQAGARFHRFARGAVLVAHNAPFDIAFLRRHEAEIGAPFDHPVLDTVLLSAVIFGQLEEHSLDALTARLGITIPEEARHTALGDALATADAFVKLIPMLRARGLTTFGAVLTEVRRHGRLLKDLNS